MKKFKIFCMICCKYIKLKTKNKSNTIKNNITNQKKFLNTNTKTVRNASASVKFEHEAFLSSFENQSEIKSLSSFFFILLSVTGVVVCTKYKRILFYLEIGCG